MSFRRVGTTTGDAVQLDSLGRMPAVSGAGLTGLTVSEYFLTMAADQAYGSIAVGDKALLTTQNPAGGISVAAGVITLPTNSQCILLFFPGMLGASVNHDYAGFQWYDTTGGGAVALGIIGHAGAPRSTLSTAYALVASAFLDTTGGARTVEARCVIGSASGGVNPGLENSRTCAQIRIYS